ncbi:hypothetical protein ACLB2K_045105 [Fragaria x ananassa]
MLKSFFPKSVINLLVGREELYQEQELGRLTLIKTNLAGMLNHVMSVFKCNKKTTSAIDREARNFFWSSSAKTFPVAWEKICSPKSVGDLGVRPTAFYNNAAIAKLAWKIITDLSNWTVKINFDGSVSSNSAASGAIIGDSKGNPILASTRNLGSTLVLVAEATASRDSLLSAKEKGFTDVVVEWDSKLVIDVVTQKINPPWRIHQIVDDIRK